MAVYGTGTGKGERVDRQTDLFSFGIVLYEMLTGRYPFTQEGSVPTDFGFLDALKDPSWEPPPPSRFQPLIPNALDQIVAKLLAMERAKRYRLAEEVKEELEGVLKWM